MITSLRYMRRFLQGSKVWLALMIFTAILLAFMNVANAWCLQQFILIGEGYSSFSIMQMLILTGSISLSTGLLATLRRYIQIRVTNNIAHKIKLGVIERIQSAALWDVELLHTGDLASRINEDSDNAARVIPVNICNFIVDMLSCIIGISFAIYLSWQLTILVLLITPLPILWSKVWMRKIADYEKKAREADSATRSFLQEMLENPIVIRVFHMKEFLTTKYSSRYRTYMKMNLHKNVLMSFMGNGGSVLGFASFLASVSIGIHLVCEGKMALGAVVGFIQLLNYVVWPFSGFPAGIGDIKTATVSIERVRKLYDISSIPETDKMVNTPAVKIGAIWAENLMFAYSGQQPTLNKINFQIQLPGLVYVIGKSGCGKTTLLKIILGLYQPNEGNLFVKLSNGAIFCGCITHLCAYVPQVHLLFSDTIANNIRIGKPNATQAEIEAVARRAHADHFIKKLPDGYDTVVSENGKSLSVGQCQRIAIARALIKDSPILIFDEPTSALDDESRDIIMDTIQKESLTRLCIVVTHDLTNMKYKGVNMAIRDGRIVQG